MPIDPKIYHPKWSLISRLVRKRDGDCCRFCGLENDTVISQIDRTLASEEKLLLAEAYITVKKYNRLEALSAAGLTQIIITAMHLDHDISNNRFENLAAACQRCKFLHDKKPNLHKRKYGKLWHKVQLFFDFYFGLKVERIHTP